MQNTDFTKLMEHEKCLFCLENSGRTHANRECCQLRRLAQMPKAMLVAYVKGMTEEAKTKLREDLKAEKLRLKEIRK